jgi:hypothetical protein
MHRFYNKIGDLRLLPELSVAWQEEKPQILLKNGGSDPQFFPQLASSIPDRQLNVRHRAQTTAGRKEKGSDKSEPFSKQLF